MAGRACRLSISRTTTRSRAPSKVFSFGPVSFLVNNAGWDRAANFLDTTPDFWRKVVAINLFGPLNMNHVSAARSRGFGRVVNIASDAGRVGSSGEAVYAACKGGIIAFTKTLAREPRRQGRDPQHDLPRPDRYRHPAQLPGRPRRHPHRRRPQARHSDAALGVPEDYPGLVAFLLSDDAAYITGQTISVSGGLTMHG